MADKMTCPACDAHLSSVLQAFREGDPCPVCGLPADAASAVLAAQKRGADVELVERLTKAEQRAGKAEAEAMRLREKLQRIKWAIEDEDDGGI